MRLLTFFLPVACAFSMAHGLMNSNVYSKKPPADTVAETPAGLTLEERKSLPVIYSARHKSAAGLNFSLTAVQAENLLQIAPFETSDTTITIKWAGLNLQWPLKPAAHLSSILVFPEYKGTVHIGSHKFLMGQPSPEIKNREELESWSRKTYNEIFKREGSFDCLAHQECFVDFYGGPELIGVEFPYVTLLFKSSNMNLLRVRLDGNDPWNVFGPH